MRRLGPAAQPRPVVQGEDGADDLIPFAKCSRVVSRPAPPRLPSQSLTLMPQRYGDLFWESLSQRPSPTWTEEWHIPPSPKKEKEATFGGNAAGTCGIPAQVRAVTYHLEDLRRRQRIINELKKAQWDVTGAAPEPLAPATAGCRVPSATEYPGLEEARATYPQEEGHPVTTGRTQVWPEELGGVPEAALVPLEPPGPGGGLVSPDDWALWPPTALSQRAGTASAPPGAWRCSLRTSPSDLPALGTGR